MNFLFTAFEKIPRITALALQFMYIDLFYDRKLCFLNDGDKKP